LKMGLRFFTSIPFFLAINICTQVQ